VQPAIPCRHQYSAQKLPFGFLLGFSQTYYPIVKWHLLLLSLGFPSSITGIGFYRHRLLLSAIKQDPSRLTRTFSQAL
jgi:hypothetical protein